MPLTESERTAIASALEKMSDTELVRFTALVYDSLQVADFRAEQLSLLGKQFYAKVPWPSLHQGVKPPLLRTALAITRGLPEIFVIEEPAPTEPEAQAEPAVETKAEIKVETNGKHHDKSNEPIEAIVVEQPAEETTKAEGKRARK